MKRNKFFILLLSIILLLAMLMPAAAFAETTNLKLTDNKSPAEIVLKPSQNGSSITLVAEATNIDPEEFPISYKWYFIPYSSFIDESHGFFEGPKEITGAADSSYVIDSISPAQTGKYICEVQDGHEIFEYEIMLYFDTGLKWVTTPEFSNVEIGKDITLTAAAESSLENVTYTWMRWEEYSEPITLSTANTFTINNIQKDDLARYICFATDGLTWVGKLFWLVPPGYITELDITDFTLVENEKLTIRGKGVAPKYGYMDSWVDLIKYAPIKDANGNWTKEVIDQEWQIEEWPEDSIFLDGNGSATWVLTENDEEYINDFSFTITKFNENFQGIYTIVLHETTTDVTTKDISITLGEYGDITLKNEDGTSIEGTLHPAAKLNMRPLQNHVENYFKQKMPKGAEIIWSNDVTLEIHGIADTHKGELTLHIPVNKKYNGQRLTVYHYINDSEIEELEGLVTDGVLTITAESLSPFAVIAEGDSDDSNLQDPPPGGTWFGHWKNWGGSQ